MIRAAIARAATVAQFSAAVLVFAASARFTVTAITDTVRDTAPDMVPSAIKDRPVVTAQPPAPRPVPKPRGPVVKKGKSLRIPVVVSIGDDRSVVRINDTEVGHSPYVGEVSCKAGETVRIELVPKNGTKRQFLRECAPRAIRLTED